MFEINITGEVIPFPIWEGWTNVINLEEVEKQLALAQGQDLKVNINSIGGDVDEGFLIYSAIRRYAKEHNAKVTTFAKGKCYSIATVIFLSGDTRIANKYLAPFIHNAWVFTEGDSKQLIRTAVELEAVNDRIGKFYAEHTNLTYQEARSLMDDETFITPEECVNIRFATEIEEILRPAALLKILNKTNKKMSKQEKNKGFMNKLRNFMNQLDANNAELYTADEQLLVFPDLEDDAEPKVGDKAELEGKQAEGEVLMSDGRTFVFEAGVLTEIREVKEDDDTTTVEIEELRTENKALKESLEALNAKFETISNKMKAQEKNWNNLKSLMSSYSVETKDNDKKTVIPDDGEGSKNKLSNAVKNLRKDK